jgi:hypothetical protein
VGRRLARARCRLYGNRIRRTDQAASRPDEAVWILRCGDETYWVRFLGDQAPRVEPLPGG